MPLVNNIGLNLNMIEVNNFQENMPNDEAPEWANHHLRFT